MNSLPISPPAAHTCRACGQRMLKADGCTWTHVKCGSQYYRRIKYGEGRHGV